MGALNGEAPSQIVALAQLGSGHRDDGRSVARRDFPAVDHAGEWSLDRKTGRVEPRSQRRKAIRDIDVERAREVGERRVEQSARDAEVARDQRAELTRFPPVPSQ